MDSPKREILVNLSKISDDLAVAIEKLHTIISPILKEINLNTLKPIEARDEKSCSSLSIHIKSHEDFLIDITSKIRTMTNAIDIP